MKEREILEIQINTFHVTCLPRQFLRFSFSLRSCLKGLLVITLDTLHFSKTQTFLLEFLFTVSVRNWKDISAKWKSWRDLGEKDQLFDNKHGKFHVIK